ncbi:MAG: hypothetical protein PHF86_11745 [Candidatus Nanoarchaeia archaeon]|jgi:Gpi18-like mannosyltransferase|nr:hypothetical protein [Candidatus Nanoarchaeia archaeon]
MEEMIRRLVGILCFWSVAGYFLAAISKTKFKNKKQTIFWLIIYGPLCWIIFCCVSIEYLKGEKTNESVK